MPYRALLPGEQHPGGREWTVRVRGGCRCCVRERWVRRRERIELGAVSRRRGRPKRPTTSREWAVLRCWRPPRTAKGPPASREGVMVVTWRTSRRCKRTLVSSGGGRATPRPKGTSIGTEWACRRGSEWPLLSRRSSSSRYKGWHRRGERTQIGRCLRRCLHRGLHRCLRCCLRRCLRTIRCLGSKWWHRGSD